MPHQLLLPGLPPPPPLPPECRAAREALRNYPKVPGHILSHYAKQLGTSGELLFDSVMMRLGERSIPCAEHEAFDRILWLPQALVRVQIKTRHVMTHDSYVFDIKKGYRGGPTGTKSYNRSDFDILALIVLPESVIKFTAEWQNFHRIRMSEIQDLRKRPGASFTQTLASMGLAEATRSGPPEPV
ncbi:hypothetical protein LY56_03164 [Roseinatronobacter thiooxidans]|uniref:Uncharacterized protein n=1 Tax=Roseinatronobacter thiooxidans TaxID=121821 RepID=A0A2W7PRG3_9RHOB|nr:hypothetical protein [Roseinatronobacter thiooxidans]PZX37963.1 hypothetical protein LY56_03164 [Roseinatronobacter thiooxidans]